MEPITVKIVLEKGGIMPTKATSGSAAYDVYLPSDYLIKPGRTKLSLNFRMELPPGYQAMIEPRSGFSSNGMEGCLFLRKKGEREFVKGHMGIGRFDCDVIPGKIDWDYRGVPNVIVCNRDRSFYVPRGMRIAQMTIQKVEDASFIEVDSLSETERGEGGFGHTKAM